jgi:hypothetical protein
VEAASWFRAGRGNFWTEGSNSPGPQFYMVNIERYWCFEKWYYNYQHLAGTASGSTMPS